MSEHIEDLRYPIGKFVSPENISSALFEEWLKTIADFPQKLTDAVDKLSAEELQQTYRKDGWTIAQLVHHCADSHMNSFIRFKLAMTEEEPIIKPYFEDRWAKLPDVLSSPIEDSLLILRGLHARWVALLSTLSAEFTDRCFVHPEHNQRISLRVNVGIYAWHGEHHLAHIRLAKKQRISVG